MSAPLHLAGDAWLVRSLPDSGGPVRVPLNAMVIAGEQPVLVDTGGPAMRDEYWAQVEAIVDPVDVRWVFVSHDDVDHHGNLDEVLARCPDAVVVASWLLAERVAAGGPLPLDRCRWVNDGDVLAVGDRLLHAVRPPAYDSPTTRGLFDPATGVYWASDCFGTPVPHEVADVSELDDDTWTEGFTSFHALLSPWIADADPIRWRRAVGRIASLGATTIASAHGPVIRGPMVGRALDLAFGLAGMPLPAQPGQAELEAILRGAVAVPERG
jgi:flavorubredoxin